MLLSVAPPAFHLSPSLWSSSSSVSFCWKLAGNAVSSPTQELLRQNLPFTRCPGIDGETLEKPQCGLHTDPGFIQSLLDSRAFQLICDVFPSDEEQLISPSSAWHQALHRTCPPAPARSHAHLLTSPCQQTTCLWKVGIRFTPLHISRVSPLPGMCEVGCSAEMHICEWMNKLCLSCFITSHTLRTLARGDVRTPGITILKSCDLFTAF